MVVPDGSNPNITVRLTKVPKDRPNIEANLIPYKAPPIVIGIRLNVMGNPIKFIYVDRNCNRHVMAMNIAIVTVFLVLIITILTYKTISSFMSLLKYK